MSLSDYIPGAAEIYNCIKPVAEGAHEAVLLAVHQPTPLSYQLVHNPERVETSESELLAHILSDDVATGALVVPITGASGAGKSHLVRIVEARLRSSPTAKRHLIIRIPKSASLRSVVDLILKPLPDAEYAGVKTAFANALAEIDVESAAIRFQGELEIALRQLASDLLEKVRLTPSQALKGELDHANRLPLLLRDPITSEHFRKAVFPRVVRRAVAGDKGGVLDPTDGQFRVTDLDLPDEIELGQAGRQVAQYYRIALQGREGEGKTVATNVLNSVVDQATRQLFSLHESLGGMTLQDVILEIRRRLLKEGRDLILLVEDFAALTGIQETLARVLIQEGIRDGKPEFATMRSVIAVTEGYLVSRDTLATRAVREWIVESAIESEEEIFELTKALVASYMNASRWTQAELIHRFDRRSNKASTDSRDWLPVYRADDDEKSSQLLDAFGTHGEIPLFPFSDHAIRHLAKRALRHGDKLVFNPRFIISEILRRLLNGAKQAFEGKEFPIPGIETRKASAEVATWIASLDQVESLKRRYETLVVVWGDNPQTLSQVAQIRGGIFEAFGLRPPSLGELKPAPPPRGSTRGAPEPRPAPAPVDPAEVKEIEKYRTAFEEWVHGTRLPQQIAMAVRKHVAAAINEQIDWNAERCLRGSIQADVISIPNARGEDGLQRNPIKISEDNSDTDGRLRSELLALVRTYDIYSDGRSYEGFDDDLVRVANFVERLLPLAKERLRAKVSEQLQLHVLAVAANSRLLGMAETGKTPKALSNFLFGIPAIQEPLPDIVSPENVKPAILEWREIQTVALHLRPGLIKHVLVSCGCFQGTGDTANGVDIIRIVESYPARELRLELSKMDQVTAEERNALASMSDARIGARFKAMRSEAVRLRDAISKALGDEVDKELIAARLKELAAVMKEMGAWDSEVLGISPPAFIVICETFRTSALKEALEQLERSDTEASSDAPKVYQLRIAALLIGVELVQRADAVLKAAERRASTLEQQVGGIDPDTQAKAIQQSFRTLEKQLQRIE